jgi:hypothetical protein
MYSFGLLIGCLAGGCARDKATAFPKGFFFSNGPTINRTIPTLQDGSFDPVVASQIVTQDFCPITTIRNKQNLTDPPLVNEYRPKTLKVTPITFNVLEASGRQYYALDSNFGITYIAQFSETAKFEYMLEYNLLPKNPQFRLNFNVRPEELMEIQEAYSARNNQAMVLFSSLIVAPETFMIHELLDVEASVDFPVYFKANGGVVRETKSTLGHRLVFRKYEKPEVVNALLSDLNDSMFIPAPDNAALSDGDSVLPFQLVFEYKGKKYQCSDNYLKHLTSESVTFTYHKGPGLLTINATFDELRGRLVPITTAGFLVHPTGNVIH